MSEGVLVQESRKGKVFVCKVWNTIVVGSDEAADYEVSVEGVEPTHCELYPEFDGRLKVTDLSESGTWLNGVRLQGEAHARTGDTLRLGPSFDKEIK